jgi:predicted ATPase/class 3 adenylate cyclase
MSGPEDLKVAARHRVLALLMVDVEGSTRLWQADSAAAEAALTRYAELVADVVIRQGGWLPPEQGEGDGRFAAFEDPASAVAAALGVQQAVQAERWPTASPVRVRGGVHVGQVLERDGLLLGEPVHRCARICAAGHGGQVLVSTAVATAAGERLPSGGSLRDLGKHRLRDFDEPERLFQLEHPELPSEFPALRALHASGHQLPMQLDSFIGRELELAAVVKLLGSHRLVTLTGPGGSGKTRLALHAAAQLAVDEEEGQVVFVDLVPVSDPAMLAERFAAALGVRTTPETPIAETVSVALAGRPVLLVADNCEHLPDAGPVLADLLAQAAGVRVLATSREPLRVRGEQEYAVPPLAVPTDTDHIAALLSPAVQLFADRAAAVQPGFCVDAANGGTVGSICRRLDGLPLAIELAAPWLRMFSPTGLLEQLARPLDLHQRGTSRPARHRTLRATMDWSYQQLDVDQQRLLAGIAVFVGGADLNALTYVCATDLEVPVLEVVAALVEKNLVQTAPGSSPPRFRLLETIREYAAERLRNGADEDVLRDRHARYFADLAEQISRRSEGPEGVQWLEHTRADTDNLRAAIDHYVRTGQGANALQVVTDCFLLWWDLGFVAEGLDRQLATLELAPDDAPARPIGHVMAGFLAFTRDRHIEAEEHVRRGATMARAQGDVLVEAFALETLGALLRKNFDQSRAVLEQALQLVEQGVGLPVRYAKTAPSAVASGASYELGMLLMWRDLVQAQRWAEKAIHWAKHEGYPPLIASSSTLLGQVLLRRGDLATAESLLVSANAELRDADVPIYQGGALAGLAELAHIRGDLDAAERLGRELLELQWQTGMRGWLTHDAGLIADILVDGSRLEDAAQMLDSVGPHVDHPPRSRPALLVRRARLARLAGRPQDAVALLEEAELNLDYNELRPETVIWYIESSHTALHDGDRASAVELLDRLDEHAQRVGLHIPPTERRRLDDLRAVIARTRPNGGHSGPK